MAAHRKKALHPHRLPPPDKPTVEYGWRRFIITLTVVIASLLELIDTTVVNVSLPVIRGNLGATLSEVSWVIAGYALANAIVVPITGWLAMEFGRRNYFVGSIALFTVSSFLCGHAGGITELIVFRFVQGIGGGALLATSQAVLVEIFPDEQIGFANAMFGVGAIVGPTVGPVLGGYITDTMSWPWIFYVNIPVGILAAALSSIYLRNEQAAAGRRRSLDWQGLFFLVVGLGSLQLFLERGHDEDWFDSGLIRALAVTAAGGLMLFAWWELRRARDPVVNLRILKNRSTSLGCVFLFILGVGLYGVLFLYPQFVQLLLNYSAFQSGLSLMPGGLAAFVVLLGLGVGLKKGLSVRLASAAGFALFFGAAYMLAQSTLQSGGTFFGDFFWPQVWRGAGTAMLFVPLTTIALSGLKGPQIAQGSGLTNMMRQLGGSLGLALASTYVDHASAVHRARLVEHLTPYSEATRERLAQLAQHFASTGSPAGTAERQALGALNGLVTAHALQLAITDAFFYLAIFFVCCIPLLLFIPRVKGGPVMVH